MSTDPLLDFVTAAADALIESGRPYGGLFPSMLDRATGRMITDPPEPIPGQRAGDRSYGGSNLMHDEPALLTMRALSAYTGEPRYAEAADAYLARFARDCTHTATGLFPWGEHASWRLDEERVGDSYGDRNPYRGGPAIHDQLRQAPLWLLEALHAHDPECVVRHAAGSAYHWTPGEPAEYCRHAAITQAVHLKRHPKRSCDFPRHAGFYIFNLAFAHARTGRDDLKAQLVRFLDYWWEKRQPNGLCHIESRNEDPDDKLHDMLAPGQTLSLGASLFEAAELLGDDPLADTMRARGRVYCDGFLAAPHDLENRVYILLCGATTGEVPRAMPIWGSKYGIWPASYVALTALCAWRRTQDPALFAWAASVARAYAGEPMPEGVQVPAMDSGLALGLLAELYAQTGERRWLDDARRLGAQLIEVYGGAPLPRGAAGIDWYESQMGPGFLLHGLARTAMLAADRDTCPLDADFTAR